MRGKAVYSIVKNLIKMRFLIKMKTIETSKFTQMNNRDFTQNKYYETNNHAKIPETLTAAKFEVFFPILGQFQLTNSLLNS